MSEDTCPNKECGEHFYFGLSRESHRKRYPNHFSGEKKAAVVKDDAVLSDPKVKRSKKSKRENEELEK